VVCKSDKVYQQNREDIIIEHQDKHIARDRENSLGKLTTEASKSQSSNQNFFVYFSLTQNLNSARVQVIPKKTLTIIVIVGPRESISVSSVRMLHLYNLKSGTRRGVVRFVLYQSVCLGE
jgi:hypothetical protein